MGGECHAFLLSHHIPSYGLGRYACVSPKEFLKSWNFKGVRVVVTYSVSAWQVQKPANNFRPGGKQP
ncbi:hypothetical protein Y032_0005g2766 [Ancylostoma ceylanicum]|uniref:Uncharacterized protein n=1 Tax=Ancylostoma ceylanicum TaxID=53326 RepID=A0A016VSU0_9BILA|nr:hypothetical protein Y032_0005g2766 [Ancylostoma ceylanicum]